MLTWGVVAVLAVGVYGQRALGMALINPARISHRSRQVLAMVPLSILCAVTALQTFSTQGALVLDARVAGIAAAAALTWKRTPMFVVVIVAATVTAAIRLI
ncbi:MAG TPA: branched-chain amino acid transporter AzlD [Acidimicrobiaceae bacterium]|nr:branched-chain amino acid transporter AzlD [Acidimicrobiaceae bacterium]HAX05130.1 branched-chain amino acid transporter AzlD [Acidimicrobiaceae bacterium]